jgi:hypothetical protein
MHPLADTTKPWVRVEFTRENGAKASFYSYINEMTGDRISGFGSEPPSLNDEMTWIKSVIKNIRKRCADVSVTGSIGKEVK